MTLQTSDETRTPPRLERGRGLAAWRQIADALAASIRDGAYLPGAQLPTEAALAAEFGVNRHTARRALSVLATEGLVRAAQGKGTFVEARPLPYPIGRRTSFTENISGAGHQAGGELISAVVEPATADVAARLGIAAGAPVLRTEIRRFSDGVPVSTGRSCYPLPRFDGFAHAFRATGSVTAALAACGVADYRRHATDISARLATAEEAALLDLAPGRIVMLVDSVNVDAGGVPIQTTRALFAADRVQLKVAT